MYLEVRRMLQATTKEQAIYISKILGVGEEDIGDLPIIYIVTDEYHPISLDDMAKIVDYLREQNKEAE